MQVTPHSLKAPQLPKMAIFELIEIEPDLYLLQASYIGRGSKPLALDIKKDVSLGALIIPSETENLDEVVVTARRPTIQKIIGQIGFQR